MEVSQLDDLCATRARVRPARVAVVSDLAEEGWESMDLVGLMLEQGLREIVGRIEVARLCPQMRRRFSTAGNAHSRRAFNADRVLNRFWDYPRLLQAHRSEFDLFHIVDHSYAQLLHQLPAARTVVTCHDLDTFRSVLSPPQERRPLYIRLLANRTLRGLRKAAHITCVSACTRDSLVSEAGIPAERVSVVHNGIHPVLSSAPVTQADFMADRFLGPMRSHDLLHVGTTTPRKRIDLLLRVFARVRDRVPNARLIRVGGAFTPEQAALAEDLKVSGAVVALPRIEWEVLAAVYRRASLTLMPSEREGFGLPLAESLACGTPVVASDLPVLREVGGDAAEYCPVGEIENWSTTVVHLLEERSGNLGAWSKRREAGISRSSQFTWTEYARRMVEIYLELLSNSRRSA